MPLEAVCARGSVCPAVFCVAGGVACLPLPAVLDDEWPDVRGAPLDVALLEDVELLVELDVDAGGVVDDREPVGAPPVTVGIVSTYCWTLGEPGGDAADAFPATTRSMKESAAATTPQRRQCADTHLV
jgi:hypothetical protein